MQRKKQRKKPIAWSLRACSLALLLTTSYTLPLYASQTVNNENVDRTMVGKAGDTHTISGTVTTYATDTQDGDLDAVNMYAGEYQSAITLLTGSVWRPLDAADSAVVNVYSSFRMESGSMVDLAYKYSADNGYVDNIAAGYTTWPVGSTVGSEKAPYRQMNITNGKFGDDLTFRINLGTHLSTLNPAGTKYVYRGGCSDSVTLKNPSHIDGVTTSNIKLEYVLNKNFAAGYNSNFSWSTVADTTLKGEVANVFGITNATKNQSLMDSFQVTGEATNQVDGALNKYDISTELVQTTSTAKSKYYSVTWTAQKSNSLSQGAYSTANAALATRNLWRIEDGLFWKRGDDRRFANRGIAKDDFSDREGVWTNTWRGKYTYDGVQNSSFGQMYSGIQVGYDKLRDRELLGGKVYTGLFFSKMTADADFNAQNTGGAAYNSGKGDLDSTGLGAYMLWEGKKGHYLDAMVRWSKIDNGYTYTDSFGDSYRKDFDAKTYGIGARYGLRIDKGNGWFMEPQVGLSYGIMRSFNFRMDNSLKYSQDQMDMLIGRAGLSVGKSYGQGDHTGEAYLKLTANHDFMDGGNAMMYAMQNSTNPSLNDVVLASQKVDTLAGKDTWYDVTLGSNFKLGDSRDGWLEANKSFSGKVNTDWQINGGVAWHWGGPSKVKKAAAVNTAVQSPLADTAKEGAAVDKGATPNLPEGNGSAPQTNAANGDNGNMNIAGAAEPISPGGTNATGTAGTLPPGSTGEFTFAPVVVEAARPDWEKKLSPGTVSVIEVPKYAGEHKTLADLLQTVPGVYIDRISGGGTGHYSTVRVRGSSASEVNIYMDGVLVNTGSEQAVNLENLNIDNVERIEVYRGYIPARFAGAAMGGAINIVTKKPDKTGGKVSCGLRSFGGQKYNLETTAPAGDGSLLLAVNRDQAKGDFKYNKIVDTYDVIKWGIVNGKQVPVETYPLTRWRQNNGYEDNNILAKWQDKNWFVKLNYINNKTHTPGSVNGYLIDVPDSMLPPEITTASKALRAGTIDTEKTELSFGRRQQSGNVEWGWKLDAIHQNKDALYLRYDNGNRDIAFGTNTFRNNTYNASVDGTWKMGESHLLEFLATASKETMKVRFTADDAWSTNWGKKFEQYFLPKYNMSNYYLQLQDTMKLDDAGSLTFTPLVRAQKSDIGIDVKEGEGWLYSYNLGLKKKWNDQWTTWATYGTYNKLPSWYELFGDGVNLVSKWHEYNSIAEWSPETSAEHGKNWDVSVNRTGKMFGSDSDTTLTYFHRNSENLMTTMFNPLYGATWYANYGAGKIQGVELSSKMHWEKFDFTLSTTWQDSLTTKGYTAYANMSMTSWQGQPFPWTPEWTVNARLDYRFPGNKFSVFGEYNWTDELSWYNGSGSRYYYEAMGLFNIGMKYSFNKQYKLIAGVNDIANKGPKQCVVYSDSNRKNVAYPQQGRTYYMTVEYTF
ncbi:MAG: TonB-dependent receptor [Veillonellales bacterium]